MKKLLTLLVVLSMTALLTACTGEIGDPVEVGDVVPDLSDTLEEEVLEEEVLEEDVLEEEVLEEEVLEEEVLEEEVLEED